MRKLFYLIGLVSLIVFTSCAKRESVVTIHTDFGEIVLILFDETPEHKKNFLELAKGGFYDSTTFHRVIDGFVIQGGDPNSKDDDTTNDGLGSPGYTVPAEFNELLTHIPGAVAAARQPDQVNPDKNSNGSQFYIVESGEGTHFLDGGYTVFGQVIRGMDVVHEIAKQPRTPSPGDRPYTDIVMSMKIKTMSKKKITKEFDYEFKTAE